MKQGLSPKWNKNRSKLFQYKVKKRIFGHDREETTGGSEECIIS
jgi:hypothetical protein